MAAAKDTKLYTVAPGRSVVHDGKPYVAGEEVLLATDEGDRLQSLGFFLDPEGSVSVDVSGPPTIAGATIREI